MKLAALCAEEQEPNHRQRYDHRGGTDHKNIAYGRTGLSLTGLSCGFNNLLAMFLNHRILDQLVALSPVEANA